MEMSRISGAFATLVIAAQASLFAQGGQVVVGPSFGVAAVTPVGDVDDDGLDDVLFDLGAIWEVRSSATGLALPYLTRAHAPGDVYRGLNADLDADGCTDLLFQGAGATTIEFVSGRDGSLLFSFSNPNLGLPWGAADHDGDGFDDVGVAWFDPAASQLHLEVLSGNGGGVVASFVFSNTITSWRSVAWAGDVDGDGWVDMIEWISSYAQTFHTVFAGPLQARFISGGSELPTPSVDSNGDGRDELLFYAGLVDAPTGQLVWAATAYPESSMDLDGDGAVDVWIGGRIVSGSTHLPFAGAAPIPLLRIGDIDGDGREEAVSNGNVIELSGGAASSIVRTRGASGRTSRPSALRACHRLRPRLGGAMHVDLHGGIAGGLAVLALGAGVDIDLAPIGATGNRAYVDPYVVLGFTADADGHVRYVQNVPSAAALVGMPVGLQWAVVDLPANPLGLVTSNAVDFVVGN